MHALVWLGSILMLALVGCGGGGNGTDAATSSDDAGTEMHDAATDAATTDAAGTDAAETDAAGTDAAATDAASVADAASPADTGPSLCSSASRPDLGTTVQNADGIVIARDGTMYVTQPGGIGRRLPDGTLDTHWLTIAGTSTVVGLALDATNTALFVSALAHDATSSTLFRVTIASGATTPLLTGSFPFGVALGPDGMLYYSDVALDAVMRMSPTGGASTRVTAAAIMSPKGLAFESGGTLLIAESYLGRIQRVTLGPTGTESARAMVTFFGDPEGIALDDLGRIYVTSGFGNALIRMDADGTNQVTLASALGGGPVFLDFGHGALCPTDIFVAQSTIARVANDTAGAAVPWH